MLCCLLFIRYPSHYKVPFLFLFTNFVIFYLVHFLCFNYIFGSLIYYLPGFLSDLDFWSFKAKATNTYTCKDNEFNQRFIKWDNYPLTPLATFVLSSSIWQQSLTAYLVDCWQMFGEVVKMIEVLLLETHLSIEIFT